MRSSDWSSDVFSSYLEEVEAVADFWRAQGKPEYVDAVTEEPEDGFGLNFEDEFTASDNPEERKYRQACQIVIENQKASGSWLQRQSTEERRVGTAGVST